MPVILAGDLPETATYRVRTWAWLQARPGNPDGRLGTLRIHQRFARGMRQEHDVYAVVKDGDPVGLAGPAYLLLNVGDPDQPDVYRVVLGPVPSCTCRAGQCQVPSGCKHRAALIDVFAEGRFDELDTADAPSGSSEVGPHPPSHSQPVPGVLTGPDGVLRPAEEAGDVPGPPPQPLNWWEGIPAGPRADVPF